MRQFILASLLALVCNVSHAADWPNSCDETVNHLLHALPSEERKELAKFKKRDLIMLHHGYGTGIRNEFGLWGGNTALVLSCAGDKNAHPDDVSMIIIERLWREARRASKKE